MNYYNEFDAKTAAVLRELIRAGLIPAGDVDERSIVDVRASDLRGYTQCHFFAGIGGWAEALRLAGWSSDRPCGSGSCPCQPYSAAGKQLGDADPRNLWPVFFKLIVDCRALGQRWTDCIFGEQVASAIGHGWLDGISADLESQGYACGAVVLGAHSVGAPHIRQRLYWVAHACSAASQRHSRELPAQKDGVGCERKQNGGQPVGSGNGGSTSRLADLPSGGQRIDGGAQRIAGHADISGEAGRVGDVQQPRLEGHAGHGDDGHQPGRHDAQQAGPVAAPSCDGYWSRYDILPCRDGKSRRVERKPQQMADGIPALLDALRDAGMDETQIATAVQTFPLVVGQPGRNILLIGYGNAIVPECAASFVTAAMQAMSDVQNCVAPA